MKIVIIDYGAGNTKSVQFAFDRLGIESVLSSDLEVIEKADGLIFPGVGHASMAMKVLKEKGLDKIIPFLKQPVLGICLGMQLMCQSSEEGYIVGLGIFDGRVVKFKGDLNVPQMGWNQLSELRESPLFQGVNQEYVYFVHSYYLPLSKETSMSAEYGVEFSAAIQKDNFYGCQFHPEKSGGVGDIILKNFIKLCESYQQ